MTIPGTITLSQPADRTPAPASVQRSDNSATQTAVNGLIGWAETVGGTSALAYVEFTATVTATSSTEASAVTVVSAGALAFDGTTRAAIEFYAPGIGVSDTTGACVLTLFDGTTATALGQIWKVSQASSGAQAVPLSGVLVRREFVPTAGMHTFFVGIGDNGGGGGGNHAKVFAGAGGSGTLMPGYIRVSVAA